MTSVRIAHLSDLHFGVDCDLKQIEALESFLPSLAPDVIVVSGDLTQRARHGEFQAAHAFLARLRPHAPVLVIPGNHDVQWWASPLGLRGERVKYVKYRRYFGEDLTPTLALPNVVMAGVLTSHGVAAGSMTWRLRDIAVKGHLPKSETDRARAIFAAAPPDAVRVLTLHHNVLPGKISQRMGLAHWRDAQVRLQQTGADIVLCGHDHQEDAGQVDGRLAVSAAGTHSSRSRGGRPSVFNIVEVDDAAVHIQHYRWEAAPTRFSPSDRTTFARARSVHPPVSVA